MSEPGTPAIEPLEVTPELIAAAGESALGHVLRRLAAGDDDPVANHHSYV